MADRDKILDGLAWAGLSERARVACISAGLVRDYPSFSSKGHTQTHIKETVRATSPPYGRGKAVFEAVVVEHKRQLTIHQARQKAQKDWQDYLVKQARRATRLNNAYAHAFGRPRCSRRESFPGGWDDYEVRMAWEEKERSRDTGDECIGLTHQGGNAVCLVSSENGCDRIHVATRTKNGRITRTYLRKHLYGETTNLVETAVSLGGPKVRTALSIGKRVMTDWVGRRTFIHHEGQDHVHPHVEEIPWRAVSRDHGTRKIIVHGENMRPDDVEPPPSRLQWNDCD